ncbi:DUF1835 domain-containing protein [Zhouia sp. PK063]|uniref:DUF1835 domain-containing protein n=1 Tax=Zhouia sp. PK063 TaxID=3373602 RepID=UPI00379DEB00
MAKQLHITNGDSFTAVLQKLPIEGEIITWREMLCEGKTTSDVGSESFWRIRFDYLNKLYKVSKSTFIDATLKEYRSLCNHKVEEEIILWFEYDVFCQINMIAVISWLKKHRPYATVHLVCSGKEDNTKKLYGLSELTEEKVLELYKKKIELTRDDIEYADYLWQLYCSDNPIRLELALKHNKSQFKYLDDALKSHILRFPSVENGLNDLENHVLQLANTGKITRQEALVAKVLKDQKNYGFGDLQFHKMITDLKPLFSSLNPVKLAEIGQSVLQKKQNVYPLFRNEDAYLGGAPKYAFLYHEGSDKLLKL